MSRPDQRTTGYKVLSSAHGRLRNPPSDRRNTEHHDPTQHPVVINTLVAAYVTWRQRLDPLALHIGKPKEIRYLIASSQRC
jgi:hypothetical protein